MKLQKSSLLRLKLGLHPADNPSVGKSLTMRRFVNLTNAIPVPGGSSRSCLPIEEVSLAPALKPFSDRSWGEPFYRKDSPSL